MQKMGKSDRRFTNISNRKLTKNILSRKSQITKNLLLDHTCDICDHRYYGNGKNYFYCTIRKIGQNFQPKDNTCEQWENQSIEN